LSQNLNTNNRRFRGILLPSILHNKLIIKIFEQIMSEPLPPISSLGKNSVIDPAAMRARYFENQAEKLKVMALKDATPAKLTSSTGNNEKLSYKETQTFIEKEITATRNVAIRNKKLKTAIQEVAAPCAYLEHETVSENAENKLTGFAKSTGLNIELLKKLASNIDHSKEVSELAERWMVQLFKSDVPGNKIAGVSDNKEIIDLIRKKFHKTSGETIAAIQDVLQKNPDIAAALKKLPSVDLGPAYECR
jgi:hypothetical protein